MSKHTDPSAIKYMRNTGDDVTLTKCRTAICVQDVGQGVGEIVSANELGTRYRSIPTVISPLLSPIIPHAIHTDKAVSHFVVARLARGGGKH